VLIYLENHWDIQGGLSEWPRVVLDADSESSIISWGFHHLDSDLYMKCLKSGLPHWSLTWYNSRHKPQYLGSNKPWWLGAAIKVEQHISECLACQGDPQLSCFIFYFLASKHLWLKTCMASYKSVSEEPSHSAGKISSYTILYEAVQVLRSKTFVAKKRKIWTGGLPRKAKHSGICFKITTYHCSRPLQMDLKQSCSTLEEVAWSLINRLWFGYMYVQCPAISFH
jgi:hypothetical protein